MVYAQHLKCCAARLASSSLAPGTTQKTLKNIGVFCIILVLGLLLRLG